MIEYPKMENLFTRDSSTHKYTRDWKLPEFGYLSENLWVVTEKIDGMNVRVSADHDTNMMVFRGRTDNAQMPGPLLERLNTLFSYNLMTTNFGDGVEVCLYGEGFGPGIQKGGKYGENVDFILFDVRVGEHWLHPFDIAAIAMSLMIRHVPIKGVMQLERVIQIVEGGFTSAFGDFEAEGVVIRPTVPLFNRYGGRIMAKLKGADF